MPFDWLLQLWQTFATEIVEIWNDLYEGETPPDSSVFLATYFVMSDIKDTLENDLVKYYSAPWNDTLLTIEELEALCPLVSLVESDWLE